jgi:hypothetical protein
MRGDWNVGGTANHEGQSEDDPIQSEERESISTARFGEAGRCLTRNHLRRSELSISAGSERISHFNIVRGILDEKSSDCRLKQIQAFEVADEREFTANESR